MAPEASGSESPIRQVGDQIGRLWWVPLAAGLLSFGFGLAVLATDWTVRALVVVTGVALVVRGLSIAFNPTYAADGAAEQVAAGVVGVVAGVLLLAWPEPTLLVLAVILGGWLALSGAFNIVTSLARRRHLDLWGVGVAVGVVELLLGIWAMRRPEDTLSLLVTVIGLWAVITGVILCVQAFELRALTTTAQQSAARSPTIDLRDAPPAEARTTVEHQ